MATARLSHKRTYDDFLTPHGSFGYSAHAGRNVERWNEASMDVMEDVVPQNKRAKFAMHEDDSPQTSQPSTQARIAAKVQESLRKLNTAEAWLNPQTWLKALPRGRRRHHELIGTVGCVGKGDSVFSIDDVTHIVSAALKAQEDKLHLRYQEALAEKVTEVVREYEAEKEAEIRSRQRDQSEYSYYS